MSNINANANVYLKIPIVNLIECGVVEDISHASYVDPFGGYAYLNKEDVDTWNAKSGDLDFGEGFTKIETSARIGELFFQHEQVKNLDEFDTSKLLLDGDEFRNIKFTVVFDFFNHKQNLETLELSYMVNTEIKKSKKDITKRVCDESNQMISDGIGIVSWRCLPESVMCIDTNVSIPMNISAKLTKS